MFCQINLVWVKYLLFDHMYIRLCIYHIWYIYYFSRNSTDLYYKDYHLLFCWKQFGWYKFFLYKNSHFVHLLFGRWCHLRIYKYFYSHFWTLVYLFSKVFLSCGSHLQSFHFVKKWWFKQWKFQDLNVL